MTATNDFNSEISNSSLDSLQYYVDTDGSLNFVSPYISSANFDGTIPVVEQNITASSLAPGMLLEVNPSQFFPVISLQYDDPDLEVSPSSNITVSYLDSTNSLNSVVYNFLDTVLVRYEDWDQKVLGTQGWSITSGGNAIFANVGVRGDLEATTLDVGGDLGITYDGTTVTLGASVVINAPVTFNGSGSFVTFNDLTASYALQSFVDSVNARLSASYTDLVLDFNTISSSVDYLISASLVSEADLITNGATKINGNNITTGTLDANNVLISSGLTGLRGVKINSLGLFAYNSGGTETFSINSGTGNVTLNGGTLTITSGSNIDGYATDGELSSGLSGKVDDGQAAADIITYNTTITGGNIATGRIKSGGYSGPGTGSAFSITGMLINLDDGGVASKRFRIDPDGNAVFSGSVIAGVFKSNNSITPALGSGVYLDNDGNVRFSNANATLAFNSTGLSITGAGVTIGGTNPDDFLVPGDVGLSGNTTIAGNRITTGVIDSTGYNGVTDGSAFALSNGMAINLDNGTLTAKRFRIDQNGNAVFSGSVIAGVFKSSDSITPTSGNGVYLDNEGKVRLASSTNSLTFDGTNVVVQGQIKGTSGFFGTENNNWSFGTETIAGYPTAYIRSGTLKLYTALSGNPPIQHGSIIITASDNSVVGRFSNPLSSDNKTIYALGNGIHLGTELDYLFIPGPNNTRSPLIRSNGFEFRAADISNTLAFKVGNNEISIPAGSTINFWNDSQSTAAFLDYGPTNNILVIAAGPQNGPYNGVVNIRASQLQLNGTPITGGGGGGGVTSFKFGDNGPTETGAVAITGEEIITAINNNSIPNGKLENKTITIGATNPATVNLGGTLGDGSIDGNVITADSLNAGKIKNGTTLFTLGSSLVGKGSTLTSLPGLSSINVSAGGLNYALNLGTTSFNLNRNSGAQTLTGVTVDGLSAGTPLFTLGTTAFTRTTTAITTISGGITLNGGPILGGGPVLGGGTTIQLGSGTPLTVNRTTNTGPLVQWQYNSNNISGATISLNAAGTAVAYNTGSDYRIKENVTDLDDSLNKLTRIYPKKFNFISDSDSNEYTGFIAHELQEVCPEAVTGQKDEVDSDGNPVYQGVDYSKLVPLLTAALQEAVKEIDTLKNRLDAAGL